MSFTKTVFGLEEAQAGLAAMLEGAGEDPRPQAFAIVNDQGDLVLYAHMDRCPLLAQGVARKKAYTAARMRTGSGAFGDFAKKMGWQVSDFGDPYLLGIQGGLPIKDRDGVVIGAVGVSGRQPAEDDAVAQRGLNAIEAALR